MENKKITTNAERVRKYREALKARGGKEVRVALEAKAVERLEILKKYYGLSYGEIIDFALVLLTKQRKFFNIGSRKEKEDITSNEK
jgi:hypothetical protein